MKQAILCVFIFLTLQSNAQNSEIFGLQDCIDYALAHNIAIKQSQASAEIAQVQFDQSRYLRYPSINGSYNLNANAGRNIDPFSNSVVTQTIGTNNLGIGASIPVYDALKNRNTIARNELNYEASQMDIQTQKNNISLLIASAFLNVLSTEDLIIVAEKQLATTNLQLERTKKLVAAGTLSETTIFELESQIANDELILINNKNNYDLAILNLKQTMNAPYDLDLKVQRIDVPSIEVTAYPEKPHDIYNAAIAYLPEIKAGEIRLKAADKNIAIAKSLGMPTASLSSSWGSAYSSVAKTLSAGDITYSQIPVSTTFQGQTVPLVLNFPQQSYNKVAIPYLKQIGNNQNLNLGLAVRVPIFNGFNQKYQTQLSKIQKKQTDLQNQNTKLQIKQNIDQAYINMLNAQKRYSATSIQVSALEKTFHAVDLKFNNGSNNYTDYSLAKTNLDRSKANLIIAKYDYIFRIKILDFYQNKPLY